MIPSVIWQSEPTVAGEFNIAESALSNTHRTKEASIDDEGGPAGGAPQSVFAWWGVFPDIVFNICAPGVKNDSLATAPFASLFGAFWQMESPGFPPSAHFSSPFFCPASQLYADPRPPSTPRPLDLITDLPHYTTVTRRNARPSTSRPTNTFPAFIPQPHHTGNVINIPLWNLRNSKTKPENTIRSN